MKSFSKWRKNAPIWAALTRVAFLLTALSLLTACQSFGAKEQIAFESYRDGNAEIYMVDEDGENLVNLTQNPAYDGMPSWSPDGQRLAFASEREGNPDIHILDIESGEVVRVTNGGGFNVDPAWSPDGAKLLFLSNRTYRVPGQGGSLEVQANPKLWTVNVDGVGAKRMTSELGLDMFGDWSPDGRLIVFMSTRDANEEIYLRRADGSEENLTNHPARDTNPAFSPDGRRVAFMSDRDGNMEIYVLDLESRELINITNNPAEDGDPAWSPDGSRIAFISDRDGNIEVYIMDADGSNVKRLTNNPADDIHPQWRPKE
ncbi:MAG: hypothetical protein GXP42_03900 [Chloroflexi bacterium]|nr:hypothetical protein [Chloroflexota bacterium]